MKLSTKGRYGVMAMLDLAMHEQEGNVTLKQIAERQGISETYLEQIFLKLRKASLVKSERGAQGGYQLSKPASQTSVGEILFALEGQLAPVPCGSDSDCCANSHCKAKPVWEKIHQAIDSVVNTMYLTDLL